MVWSRDFIPCRLFRPVLFKYAAQTWSHYVESTMLNKVGISYGDEFDPHAENGWQAIVGRLVGDTPSEAESIIRRLYSIKEGETLTVSVDVGDRILTRLGCLLEMEDEDIPIMPGNPKRVREMTQVWLDRDIRKDEDRDVMRWVTRFVYSDTPWNRSLAPELFQAQVFEKVVVNG